MSTPKTSGGLPRSGRETPPPSHADKAMTKMHAEAAEAKVVLIEWNTPECISPDTKEAIRKWCFKLLEMMLTLQLCRVPANFLGGTISGNLAPTPP